MKIADYISEFDVHPFLLNFIIHENMDNFYCIKDFDSDDIYNLIEETIRRNGYSNLSSYYTGDLKNFRMKTGDKIRFKQIAQDARNKGKEFFEEPKINNKIKKQTWDNEYPFLKMMVQQASKLNRNYDQKLKDLGLYLFLKSGPSTYKFMTENLPLPSIQTVKNELGSIENVIEGEVRVKEFIKFLEVNKLPPVVWLSEDATRSITKIEYDSKADKFVGFVLPLDENGLPESSKFTNMSAKNLVVALKEHPKSSYVYTIMVQPLQDRAASFCICVFGTDNKFKTPEVKKRVQQIKQLLNDAGVMVLGISSDGDSRLLKYMRLQINLGNARSDLPEGWNQYFYADLFTNISPMQDNLHILTKLRNGLTKPNSSLVIGKYAVCSAYLINLIKQRPKGEHLLVMSDVIVIDKMNVTSALKLFSFEVFDCLQQYHEQEAKGLILFLKIMEYLYTAFESREITFEERVKKMWFCVFIWKNIEPAGNFITLNAYTCIEINAHMLISVYVRLRDSGNLKFFKPWYFNSQTCENFFRKARSLTTTESTVINFTTNQFLHRIKRIQRLIELTNSQDKINSSNESLVEPVSDEMILSFIEKAKSDAISYMTQLDVKVNESHLKIGIKGNPLECKQESLDECIDSDNEDADILTNSNEENLSTIQISDEESEDIDEDTIVQDCSGLLEECTNIAPKKGYFVLKNSKGKLFEIKKGSFLYAYQSPSSHSTDRMFRFNTARDSFALTNNFHTNNKSLNFPDVSKLVSSQDMCDINAKFVTLFDIMKKQSSEMNQIKQIISSIEKDLRNKSQLDSNEMTNDFHTKHITQINQMIQGSNDKLIKSMNETIQNNFQKSLETLLIQIKLFLNTIIENFVKDIRSQLNFQSTGLLKDEKTVHMSVNTQLFGTQAKKITVSTSEVLQIYDKWLKITQQYIGKIEEQLNMQTTIISKDLKSMEIHLSKTLKEQIKIEVQKQFIEHSNAIHKSVLSGEKIQTPTTQHLQNKICGLLEQCQINKAFHLALISNDLSLVEFTLQKANFSSVFNPCRLEQSVLLSLIQQLFLAEAIINLKIDDSSVKEHGPRIMNELRNNCEDFIIENPSNFLSSYVKMLIMASKTIA
uniref:CSON014468 protein n=1 Tax=Culicoides sonorensis TaxID=179676 RepID=A0A336MEY4_CULSO